MVSSSVSPLLVDETPMLRLMTSADRRLAAISNVVRVRVLFSKKRLNTVLPRSSGTFLTSRSAMRHERHGGVEDASDDLRRHAFQRQQMLQLAVGVELRVRGRFYSTRFASPRARRESSNRSAAHG